MYIVEGNIGAGKSTFLKIIQELMPEVDVIFEPVNQWHNDTFGKSLLADFYQDPKRWAYTLETYAMACRVRDHLKESSASATIKIMERSIYSGHYCFAKNDYLSGYLTTLEWEIYTYWFEFLIKNKISQPKGFIYLQTTPEVALARIQKRSRAGESSITLEYLQNIHARHEEFLIDKDVSENLLNIPVLVLNGNLDFEHDKAVQRDFINQIKAFIKL